MRLKGANRDSGSPPRFILDEEVNSSLDSTKNYFVAEEYSCRYELECNFAGRNSRTLEFASKDDFKFSGNRTSLLVPCKGKVSFEVIFLPRIEGDKEFRLIVKGTARQGSLTILDRYLNVGRVKPQGSLKVRGYVENKLPIQMQLGEDQQITFVFENKSSRDVKDFKITIRGIKK